MNYKRTTHVPNELFDIFLPVLSLSELRVILVVVRQTFGWIDKKTGQRKKRDRISHSQFIQKTGLSRRVISLAIQSLVDKGLLTITDFKGNLLKQALDRQGKSSLYYNASSIRLVQKLTQAYAESEQKHVQKGDYNKTNREKLTKSKRKGFISVGKIIRSIWIKPD